MAATLLAGVFLFALPFDFHSGFWTNLHHFLLRQSMETTEGDSLRESHQHERQFHDQAIAKLQIEDRRLQDRIDTMYLDKLDGRIVNTFFDRKAADFRSEQARVMRDVETHQNANQSYIEEGIRLLELAHQAHLLFENRPPAEKRKLLHFVLSNCRWRDAQLEAEYRKPSRTGVLSRKRAFTFPLTTA